MKNILLTSTSFQDSPGIHHDKLYSQNFKIDCLRGPLKESELLNIIGNYDGIICGDDEITKNVILNGKKGKLRCISKYGAGLDKIDLKEAKKSGIKVLNCPGINKTTVSEHVFALILTYIKNIIPENKIVQNYEWKRLIGYDLYNKNLGILGLGNIGKEVAIRAKCFGMTIRIFDNFPDHKFIDKNKLLLVDGVSNLIANSDILTLHLPLDNSTINILNMESLNHIDKSILIVNTSRSGLVDNNFILEGIKSKKISGYLTDVLDDEPIKKNNPFVGNPNILITPHIGSRTYDNIVKQGLMSVENLIKNL